jgi:wyosine [tRNA(Phe)-imidazoG37] synthetase (radical SAM superfamily)
MLQGQIDLRRIYSGQIWLEVMMVRGVNDSDEDLAGIKQAVTALQPDRVYLLTPIRPPAESWVNPPDPRTILKAQQTIGRATAMADRESGDFGLSEFESAEAAIMQIGSRHPLRLSQATEIETKFAQEGTIRRMLEAELLIRVEYDGAVYLLPAHFLRGKATIS